MASARAGFVSVILCAAGIAAAVLVFILVAESDDCFAAFKANAAAEAICIAAVSVFGAGCFFSISGFGFAGVVKAVDRCFFALFKGFIAVYTAIVAGIAFFFAGCCFFTNDYITVNMIFGVRIDCFGFSADFSFAFRAVNNKVI